MSDFKEGSVAEWSARLTHNLVIPVTWSYSLIYAMRPQRGWFLCCSGLKTGAKNEIFGPK